MYLGAYKYTITTLNFAELWGINIQNFTSLNLLSSIGIPQLYSGVTKLIILRLDVCKKKTTTKAQEVCTRNRHLEILPFYKMKKLL